MVLLALQLYYEVSREVEWLHLNQAPN